MVEYEGTGPNGEVVATRGARQAWGDDAAHVFVCRPREDHAIRPPTWTSKNVNVAFASFRRSDKEHKQGEWIDASHAERRDCELL